MVVGLVLGGGTLMGACVAAVLGASGTKERVALGVLAAALAVPFVWVTRRALAMAGGMGVDVDTQGVRRSTSGGRNWCRGPTSPLPGSGRIW
jgi:hypothetical protein